MIAGEACLIEIALPGQGTANASMTMARRLRPPLGRAHRVRRWRGPSGQSVREDLIERVRLTAAADHARPPRARRGVPPDLHRARRGLAPRRVAAREGAALRARHLPRRSGRTAADLGPADKDVRLAPIRHFDDGGDVTGLRTLAGLIDERVFKRAKHRSASTARKPGCTSSRAPQRSRRASWPKSLPIESLRHARDHQAPGS